MIRKKYLSVTLLSLLMILSVVLVNAQDNIAGMTIDTLNVRSGPGTEFTSLTTIPARTNIVIEGRNTIGNWVLIHTADNAARGWVASRYTIWDESIELGTITVTNELLQAPAASAPADSTNPPVEAAAPPSADGITGMTIDTLNVRTGPGTENTAIGRVPARTHIVIEGRNTVGNWVLIHTMDNSLRGWVASRYTTWDESIGLSAIPVTDIRVNVPAPAAPTGSTDSLPVGEGEAAMITVLESLPIVPAISGNVRVIYQRGLGLGNNPQNFTKIGDSNSESQAYLGLIGQGAYNLGPYGYLQATIDYYKGGGSNSFTAQTQTAKSGLLTTTIIDSLFSDPRFCAQGQSPLECEFGRTRPSIALIYLGAADRQLITHDQFSGALRQIVDTAVNWGIIPVLMTAPTKPHYQQTQQRGLEFDMIVLDIARQYDIPVINMWKAVRSLPEGGLIDDLLHFTYSGTPFMNFNGDEQVWGYTAWNLAVLQTLDAIRKAVG